MVLLVVAAFVLNTTLVTMATSTTWVDDVDGELVVVFEESGFDEVSVCGWMMDGWRDG